MNDVRQMLVEIDNYVLDENGMGLLYVSTPLGGEEITSLIFPIGKKEYEALFGEGIPTIGTKLTLLVENELKTILRAAELEKKSMPRVHALGINGEKLELIISNAGFNSDGLATPIAGLGNNPILQTVLRDKARY